jgi:hypothetical protein
MRNVLAGLLLVPLATVGGRALRAADLPLTETPVGRLSLPVLPDSVTLSPDSSRLAFASNAGQITLEDKGVFLQPPGSGRAGGADATPRTRGTIRLYIDDKGTAAFEVMTPAVFSPDSKRVAFTGKRDNKWQVVVDNRTVVNDADAVPATPLLFSPDSKRVATVVQKGEKFHIMVEGEAWPPIDAYAVGIPAFSPDSAHLALVTRDKGAWILYVDGKRLPTPPLAGPAATTRPTAPGTTRPAPVMGHFGEFKWRPDSSGLGFYGGIAGGRWQVFSQSLDGTVSYSSPLVENLTKGSPVFAADGTRLAFATSSRNKWTVMSNTGETPAAAQNFDALRAESVTWIDTEGGPKLVYLAQRNRKWQAYLDHAPVGTAADALDSITEGSFQRSPDRRHYAYAGIRGGRPAVIKDGTTIGTHDELGAGMFVFSPDSQHVAYAARKGTQWFACVDGQAGAAGFAGIAAQPLAFSPDSGRVAFTAVGGDKLWRLVVGKDGEYQSKGYESFVKGSQPSWRDEGTLTTIAIQKRVALRLEAKVPLR